MHIISKVETTEKENIANSFFTVANNKPDQIAFKGDGGQGKCFTYSEVQKLVRVLAAALLDEKYADIHEIGLISENRPEWGITYLAITAAGKTVIPIDVNYKEKEIDYIIQHSGLKTIFTSVRFESSLLDKYDDLNVYSYNEGSPHYWMNLTNHDLEFNSSNANPDDVAVLIYTSGTTGDPKAVELTHKNLLSNIHSVNSCLCFDSNDIFLSVLPLHHTFEQTGGLLTPLLSACTIVYARSLKSKEILEDIKNNNITLMIGVPLLFEKIYHSIRRGIKNAPASKRMMFNTLYKTSSLGWKLNKKWGKELFKHLRAKAGLGTIRMFVSGGAAMSPLITEFYNYIGFDFFQGYGLTECSPVVTANRPDNIKFGSVGPLMPGIEVKIHEPDETGVGEIIVKGDNVTPGYRNNPEETAILIRDGWLYTGDLGKFEDGHLWITGRKKNLIVSAAGKNIYPEQIEEKLLDSLYIMESVVFGRTREGKQGEEVCALIVPELDQFKAEYSMDVENPDKKVIEDVIKNEVSRINQQMSQFKRVTDYKVQIDELEKTSTKKVKRFIYK
jgi:long-chain acyl-CoA synthetase